MDAKFWHERWEQNKIGFHLGEANPLLVSYFDRLKLAKGARVFLPLCGKTRDMAWLLERGYRVVGAELSELAIEQLFKDLKMTPQVSRLGSVTHFSAKNIDIFVGDVYEVSSALLGATDTRVDAIYDRAALVALPQEVRQRYSTHLMRMTNVAPQLLITYEYDQSLMDGPPFSVSSDEVRKLYESRYKLTELASVDVPGGMRGKIPAIERVWLLTAI